MRRIEFATAGSTRRTTTQTYVLRGTGPSGQAAAPAAAPHVRRRPALGGDAARRPTPDPRLRLVAGRPDRPGRALPRPGSTWHPARLAEPNIPRAWVRWKFEWAATPGDHAIVTRATDDRATSSRRRSPGTGRDTGTPSRCPTRPGSCSARRDGQQVGAAEPARSTPASRRRLTPTGVPRSAAAPQSHPWRLVEAIPLKYAPMLQPKAIRAP